MLTLIDKLKVARARVGFGRPVVAHDAIYAGCEDDHVVKFDRALLTPQWRLRSEGFRPWFGAGEVLLLTELGSGRARGVRSAGTVAWTLDRKGRWGWGQWRDRLFSLDVTGGMAIADPATGQIVDQIDIGPRAREYASRLCGDVLLLRDEDGDPYRAYDLARREFLWERPLLKDIASARPQSGARPLMIRPAGEQLFVGARGTGVFGIGLRSGDLLWSRPIAAQSVDVHGGRVYAWGTTDETRTSHLVCLDLAGGAVVFTVRVTESQPWPQAAISERHIVYAGRSGFIAVLRRSDGSQAWSYQHKQRIADAAVIAGNRLFVPAEDGHLLVFEGEI